MTTESWPPEPIPADEHDPRVQAALGELRERILTRFPAATFAVMRGEDPDEIQLNPTVDIEDLDEVLDVVIERLVDMRVEEGLPVAVIPAWPPERIRDYLRRRAETPRSLRGGHLDLKRIV